MQTSPSRRTEKFDQWLIGFSLLGIFGFLFLLYDESWLHVLKSNNHQIKIGSASKISRDVRRRFQDDFIWLPLSDLESVYFGDSIFTGSNSTTSIKLDSGVNLWIDSDSLIVLDQSSDFMKLDLKFGHLRGRLSDEVSSGLKLNINNQDLDLSGKSVEFFLEKGRATATNLKVTDGIANLTEVKTKKIVKLDKSQQIKIERSVASIESVVPREEEPVFVRQDQWAIHRNVWFTQKQPLKFTWQTEGPVDHFEFILSRKSNMSAPILKETLKVNGYEWLPPFDEGTLFWQIRAIGQNGSTSIETEPIQWNIGLLLAPEWTGVENPWVVAEADLKKTEPKDVEHLEAHWSSSLKTVLYRVEWSQNINFTDPQSAEVQEKKWKLPPLQIGQYFVRVRSEGLGRPASLWSNPLILKVTDKDPNGLISPKMNVLEVETLEKSEAAKLEWATQDRTSDYVVEISDRADFSKLLKTDNVKKTAWVGLPRPEGLYYVRVFPLAQNGRRGPVSEVVHWNSRVAGPQWKAKGNSLLIAIPRDKNDQLRAFPETPLQWKDSSHGKVQDYLFEQSSSLDFSNAKPVKIQESKVVLKDLTPNVYYYRVRSAFVNGKVSLASVPLRVDVVEERADGLRPPVMLTKGVDSKIEGDKKASTKVRWESIEGVSHFRVQVSDGADFKNILSEKEVSGNDSEMSIEKPGTYSIRVSGISKNKRQGPWGATVTWNVILGAPIVQPIDVVRINVRGADSPIPPTFVLVHWKSPKVLNNFKLQIAEDDKFSKMYLEQAVKGHEFKVRLTKIGKFKVRVLATDAAFADKALVSPTVDLKFIIDRPLLPPTLLTPKDKVSYILSKMINPQIWLEWNSDKLANVYQIDFAKDKGFNKIIHTMEVREKKVLLDHSVIHGKIYWRVKAKNDEQNLESPWSQVWSLSVVDIENED